MISTPLAILIGTFGVWAWARLPRLPVIGVAALAGLIAVPLAFYNATGFAEIQATREGVERAVKERLFPLGLDIMSQSIAAFLLHGSEDAKQLITIQHHDFLTGETNFPPITGDRAFILVNHQFAERQQTRNLVTPIAPSPMG